MTKAFTFFLFLLPALGWAEEKKTVPPLVTLPPPAQPVCTQAEYDRLRKHVGLAELAAKGTPVMLLNRLYQNPHPTQLNERERTERLLFEQGIRADKVKAYVAAMTALAPDCLGGISLEFLRLLRRDVLMERGQYLLEVLRDHVVSTGRRPDSVDDLTLVDDHPVFGDSRDPYGNSYVVTYSPFEVALKSLGPDAKHSVDDIEIGSLDISR
jgi:hypothetical protein